MSKKLVEREKVIERNLSSFYETGQALKEIRDERLYQETHETFAEYCRKRWEMSKTHANRMIEASSIVANLTPMGVTPATERQARALAGLSLNDQREVWQEAVETAPKSGITAKHIQETRATIIEESNPEQETLFTLDDYRMAIDQHVSAANEASTTARYHTQQARRLQKEAFKKFGVQLTLDFEYESEEED